MNTPEGTVLPRRRVWPALLVSALVVVLGLQAFFERGRRQPLAAVAANGAASAPAGSVSASAAASTPRAASTAEPQWGQPGEAAARVARAASAALATARAAAGLDPAQPADTELELCGVGRLNLPQPLPAHSAGSPRVQAAWEALPQALGEPARRQAWLQVIAALSAPGQTERARAAAWLLQASGTAETAAAAGAAPAPAAAAAVRSLARLARTSRDATVVQWALAACSGESKPSADCRRVSVRELVRLAPDDGLNWLRVAGAPGAATVTAAAESARLRALTKASQADRFGPSQGQLAVLVDSAWPDGLPGYLRLQLLRSALAVEAELVRPALETGAGLCTAQAVTEPGRHALCDALARRMLEQGRDGAVLATVAVLAGRLGWAEADLDVLKREEAALLQATAPLLPTDHPYACPVLDDMRNWVQSVAADGELQAARRRLAMKPTTARPAASRP